MKKIRVIKFTASWCGPCSKLAYALSTNKQAKDLDIIVADVETKVGKELSTRYYVDSLPTMVCLTEDGKEFYRWSGFDPKTLNHHLSIALGGSNRLQHV